MKLAQASNKFTHPKDVHCIIPLVAPTESKDIKIYTKEFKLQADPTDNNNTNEVKVKVEVFSADLPNSPERLCILIDDVEEIIAGQGITESPGSIHQVFLQVSQGSRSGDVSYRC